MFEVVHFLWLAWRWPRRRAWTVWAGEAPVAHRRTVGEADRMIAVDPERRRAVDTRRAPTGPPPLAREVLGPSPSWLRRWSDAYADAPECARRTMVAPP